MKRKTPVAIWTLYDDGSRDHCHIESYKWPVENIVTSLWSGAKRKINTMLRILRVGFQVTLPRIACTMRDALSSRLWASPPSKDVIPSIGILKTRQRRHRAS